MVKGIGPVLFRTLVNEFGTPGDVFKYIHESENWRKLAPSVRGFDMRLAKMQVKKAREAGAEIIAYADPEYPNLIGNIDYAPPVLYLKGNVGIFAERSVAVVGTRRPTYYGKAQARKFARTFAEAGVVVVSGGARGIDTQAHVSTLEAGGITVAVLGSGLDVPYPRENVGLFKKILNCGGAVLTEFPFGTLPLPHNFLRRNRIISGLSEAVIIVEAGKRSGALNTASWAAEQGRDVFAIPGPIDSASSMGTNELIKKGAHIALCPEDVLETMGIVGESNDAVSVELKGAEKMVFDALTHEPVHVDNLAKRLNMDVVEVLVHLLSLELKGLIVQLPGKFFRLAT